MLQVTAEVVSNVMILALGIVVLDIAIMIIDKILFYICTAFNKVNPQDLNWALKKVSK